LGVRNPRADYGASKRNSGDERDDEALHGALLPT
jgi:hypothetical protein